MILQLSFIIIFIIIIIVLLFLSPPSVHQTAASRMNVHANILKWFKAEVIVADEWRSSKLSVLLKESEL